MYKWLSKSLYGETFRYLIFGILTVVVNIMVYHVLAEKLSALTANTIAFFIAVLFAYWTNSTFVFRTVHTWKNFTQFIGMRVGTLVIDDGGLYLLLSVGVNDLLAKCVVNVIIIVINYLLSKWIIFCRKEK